MYYPNNNKRRNLVEFIVESASDVSLLPTSISEGDKSSCIGGGAFKPVAVGSMALCVATGDLYVLTSDNKWTKVGG